MSRDDAPKTDLLVRRRREQQRQAAQDRRDRVRRPVVWIFIVLVFCLGCCGCPVWSWIRSGWLWMIG